MAIFKVSYVIAGGDDPGSIVNQEQRPQPGDHIHLGNKYYEVIEVLELVPPRGDFHYMHATCRTITEAISSS